MIKLPLALFVVAAIAGCDTMPVRYVPVYYSVPQQNRLVMPQAPTGETAPAPAATASVPAPAPAVIIVPATMYVPPPVYYNPVVDIAAGYLIWRSLGGWHGGHGGHHRRGR